MKQHRVLIGMLSLIVVISLLGFGWYQLRLFQAGQERDNASTREVEVTEIQDRDGTTVSEGTFVRLDAAHQGSGSARIIATDDEVLLQFDEDFEVSNGPDLYVWLVKEQELGGSINGVDTDPDTFLELGPLRDNSGLQQFSITQEEADEFNYAVVIWCRAFGVHFTNAVLESV